jgi:hypothetical protein
VDDLHVHVGAAVGLGAQPVGRGARPQAQHLAQRQLVAAIQRVHLAVGILGVPAFHQRHRLELRAAAALVGGEDHAAAEGGNVQVGFVQRHVEAGAAGLEMRIHHVGGRFEPRLHRLVGGEVRQGAQGEPAQRRAGQHAVQPAGELLAGQHRAGVVDQRRAALAARAVLAGELAGGEDVVGHLLPVAVMRGAGAAQVAHAGLDGLGVKHPSRASGRSAH